MIRHDRKAAWEKYMAYTKLGGSDVWTALLEKAGLDSPFAENTLKSICAEAQKCLAEMEEKGSWK